MWILERKKKKILLKSGACPQTSHPHPVRLLTSFHRLWRRYTWGERQLIRAQRLWSGSVFRHVTHENEAVVVEVNTSKASGLCSLLTPVHFPSFFPTISRGGCWSPRRTSSVSWWRRALRTCWTAPSASWHCSSETNSSSAKPTRSSCTCTSRSSVRSVTDSCPWDTLNPRFTEA